MKRSSTALRNKSCTRSQATYVRLSAFVRPRPAACVSQRPDACRATALGRWSSRLTPSVTLAQLVPKSSIATRRANWNCSRSHPGACWLLDTRGRYHTRQPLCPLLPQLMSFGPTCSHTRAALLPRRDSPPIRPSSPRTSTVSAHAPTPPSSRAAALMLTSNRRTPNEPDQRPWQRWHMRRTCGGCGDSGGGRGSDGAPLSLVLTGRHGVGCYMYVVATPHAPAGRRRDSRRMYHDACRLPAV